MMRRNSTGWVGSYMNNRGKNNCKRKETRVKNYIVFLLCLAMFAMLFNAISEDEILIEDSEEPSVDAELIIEGIPEEVGEESTELEAYIDLDDAFGLDVPGLDDLVVEEPSGSIYQNGPAAGEGSAYNKILIYNQYGGGWASWTLNYGASGGNNMENGGCHIFAYAHAIQWLTNKKLSNADATTLIEELIGVCDIPWGPTYYNDTDPQALYNSHIINKYGAKEKTVPGSGSAMEDLFNQGGVVIANPGGHYIIAVGAAFDDLDGNGSNEYYIHIVDSSCQGTWWRTNQNYGSVLYDFNSRGVIQGYSKSGNSYINGTVNGSTISKWGGGEYWVPYSVFCQYRLDRAYAPGEPVITATTLQFKNVTYPKTFRIDNSAGFALSGGTVESNYDLKTLKTEILNSGGGVISSATVSISGKSYAIRNLDTYSKDDNGVKFSYITAAGEYKWVLTATDSNGRVLSLEMLFTAVSDGSTVTSTAGNIWKENDTTPPTIYNVKATNITSEGYTIICNVSDNIGVTSVKFPTWTEQNGQDDLIWHEGVLSGDTASFNLKVSDHKNETGCLYITHIYANDAAGNNTSVGINIDVPAPTIEVTGVSLDKTELSMTVGDSATLVATVSPSNATDKSLAWSSSNAEVVTVSADGKVTAKGEGKATVTATSINGKKASCIVTVTVGVEGVSLDRTELSMTVGDSATLVATVSPSNATDKSLAWSSSNAEVVTVSADGKVTAKGEGTATVTVTTNNGKSSSCKVTVTVPVKPTEAPIERPTITPTIIPTVTPFIAPTVVPTITPTPETRITVTKIALNKTKATLVVGATLKLNVKLAPDNATTVLRWNSSNTKVAIVNDDGMVQAVAKGTATITVITDNGIKASCKVTVPKAPKKVKFRKSTYTVKRGKKIKLSPKLSPSGAKTIYKWSSNNKKIAIVNSKGVVKGIAKGTAMITVVAANGKKATVKVKVR